MKKHVIFDMDGLLIDSEPTWQAAEIKILAPLGVPLTLDMTHKTQGLRIDAAVEYWFDHFPWVGASLERVAQDIIQEVIHQIPAMRIMNGVLELIDAFATNGVPMAIASSSDQRIIDAVVAHMGIADRLVLTRSAMNLPYGKPHPQVFLETALSMGARPQDCIVFEDSVAGVIAAKAARMRCIAVPEPSQFNSPQYGIADVKLKTLAGFDLHLL